MPAQPSGDYKVGGNDLAALRAQLPHLSSFSNEFIINTPFKTLVKMESNALKLQSYEKVRNNEERLLANQESISIIEVSKC